MKNKNPLIFLHLTRTGGSTMREIIERQFYPSVRYRIKGNKIEETLEAFKNLPQTERDKIKFLSGHMPFGLHKYFSLPCDYITLLRDPIEKVISEYYYMKNLPQHTYYQTIKNMSLEDHALSGINSVVNYQTRILSGNWGMPHVHSLPLPPDALEVAKKNLEKYFKVVGIKEKFDETLLILRKVFGWKNIYYLKTNVGRHRPLINDVPENILRLIKRNNEWDLELHEFANHLLMKSIKEYGSIFEKDLIKFQKINDLGIFQVADTALRKLKKRLIRFIPNQLKNFSKNILTKKKVE